MKISYFCHFFAQRCSTWLYLAASRLTLDWKCKCDRSYALFQPVWYTSNSRPEILQIETSVRFQDGTDRTEVFVWQILVLMQKLAKYQLHFPTL